jgi:hypothetical protein
MWLARYGISTLGFTTILTTFSAAIFGYLEQLLQHGDPAKIASEIARLKAFNTSFPAVGFNSDMVELFMEPAMELLDKMHEALLRQDRNDTLLLQTMNSDDESNSILYYFKVCNPAKKPKKSSSLEHFCFAVRLTFTDPDKYLHAIQCGPIRAFPRNDRTRLLQSSYRGPCSRDRTGWTPSSHRRHHRTGGNGSGGTLPGSERR